MVAQFNFLLRSRTDEGLHIGRLCSDDFRLPPQGVDSDNGLFAEEKFCVMPLMILFSTISCKYLLQSSVGDSCCRVRHLLQPYWWTSLLCGFDVVCDAVLDKVCF